MRGGSAPPELRCEPSLACVFGASSASSASDTIATRTLATTLDPVDHAVRADAKHLAERLDGNTPVEVAVRSMLDDVAHGARVVVLRTEDEVTPAEAANLLGVTR